jgi:hypothetical protein
MVASIAGWCVVVTVASLGGLEAFRYLFGR